MSHTTKVACGISCSIDVLKASLLTLFPTWAPHIKTDNGGNLPYTNQYLTRQGNTSENAKSGYHLIVPSGSAGGPEEIRYADVGFSWNGTEWEIRYDTSSSGMVSHLRPAVVAEIERRNQIAVLSEAGITIDPSAIQRTDTGDVIMDIELDDDQIERLLEGGAQ